MGIRARSRRNDLRVAILVARASPPVHQGGPQCFNGWLYDDTMHVLLELFLDGVWVFAEHVCGWLGSWFLYLVSLGRWNLPNDSVRAELTGLLLLVAAIFAVAWLVS